MCIILLGTINNCIYMKISIEKSQTFNRRLRSSEKKEYSQVLREGKNKVGNTGYSMLIVPSVSLPQLSKNNTGVGNMLDKESKEFFDFAKQYWGINSIQLLPEGAHNRRFETFRPYSGTSLDLGVQLINFNLLTTDDYGKILDSKDVKELVSKNTLQNSDNIVNAKNVMGRKSNARTLLEKAYENFNKGESNQIKKLKTEFEQYKIQNKDWLEPKAVFQVLSKHYNTTTLSVWDETDAKLYDTSVVSLSRRNQRIEEILNSKHGEVGEIYKFSQFIADKHLQEARKKLNDKGIKLNGDVLLNFSKDEVWANPDAFIKNAKSYWFFPAMNYNSEAGERLLRLKLNNFAKRYDGIRIDAAWTYIEQPVLHNDNGKTEKKFYGEKNLKIIEDEFRKVKGDNFDPTSILYEFEADSRDFNIYSEFNLRPEVKDRVKIYKSDYLSSKNNWGSTAAYKSRGWNDGTYILGATNHDSEPILMTFNNLSKRNDQIKALSEILKIPENELNNFNIFKQSKFAEVLKCQHNMFFYTEALNLEGRYKDNKENLSLDYKIKIPQKYEEKYFKALAKGEGYNPMDALEKIFIAEGYDKSDPELFKKIVKYKKILQKPESKISPKVIMLFILGWIAKLVLTLVLFQAIKNKKADLEPQTKH